MRAAIALLLGVVWCASGPASDAAPSDDSPATQPTGIVWLFYSKGSLKDLEDPPIRFTYSRDDGLTWAEPVEPRKSHRFAPDLAPIRSATMHGIQLSSGGLLAPCAYVRGFRPAYLYSDDHGKTWHLGDPVAGIERDRKVTLVVTCTAQREPKEPCR